MSESPITWLPEDFSGPFPSTKMAFKEPNGLLAVGGNLEPGTLIEAYKHGIFPWYSDQQPILWWAPDPRCVLFPEKIHISRSLQRVLNKNIFDISINTSFREVMLACAEPRKDSSGTWINSNMINAYCKLHEIGRAHSIECWYENKLVGGIYGVLSGQVFSGESMFSLMDNASKVALVHLFEILHPALLDAQVYSEHLGSLGAERLPRDHFESLLRQYSE